MRCSILLRHLENKEQPAASIFVLLHQTDVVFQDASGATCPPLRIFMNLLQKLSDGIDNLASYYFARCFSDLNEAPVTGMEWKKFETFGECLSQKLQTASSVVKFRQKLRSLKEAMLNDLPTLVSVTAADGEWACVDKATQMYNALSRTVLKGDIVGIREVDGGQVLISVRPAGPSTSISGTDSLHRPARLVATLKQSIRATNSCREHSSFGRPCL
ncbi:unnamed protein product, partial [Dibothriocephalus latus]